MSLLETLVKLVRIRAFFRDVFIREPNDVKNSQSKFRIKCEDPLLYLSPLKKINKI